MIHAIGRMFMIGCMLYLAIITLFFYRLTFLKLNAETLSPPCWINMGAVGIATLVDCQLVAFCDSRPKIRAGLTGGDLKQGARTPATLDETLK